MAKASYAIESMYAHDIAFVETIGSKASHQPASRAVCTVGRKGLSTCCIDIDLAEGQLKTSNDKLVGTCRLALVVAGPVVIAPRYDVLCRDMDVSLCEKRHCQCREDGEAYEMGRVGESVSATSAGPCYGRQVMHRWRSRQSGRPPTLEVG